MYESNYKAAKLVSTEIHDHFAKHLTEARAQGERNLADEPNAEMIEVLLDAAFWASLRREEGHSTRISIAFLPPELSAQPLYFGHRMELSPEILTKLSPGIERAGVYLGVWHENDQLYIWGTTLKIPNLCFVLDVSEPGLLVVKHRRSNGFGKFTNVAVLNGDQIKIIDESNSALKGCSTMIKGLLGIAPTDDFPTMVVNPLVQLAVSMRAHKRGGTMLVVPSNTEAWKNSIIHPLKYPVSPFYNGLANLMNKDKEERTTSQWQSSFRSELESIAGLTAIDGATIITDQFELLAFGTKIGRMDGNARVERIYFSEPIAGSAAMIVNPAQSGGTRHLSAAQFVHDQQDSIAMVASQDGHFTVFAWLPGKEMVQAYRIDSLLL